MVSQIALLYGLTAFALAPLLGAATGRLAAYGWPVFWVCVSRRNYPAPYWILYPLVSWLPIAIGLDGHPERVFAVVGWSWFFTGLLSLRVVHGDRLKPIGANDALRCNWRFPNERRRYRCS